jgi:hypothetical protein
MTTPPTPDPDASAESPDLSPGRTPYEADPKTDPVQCQACQKLNATDAVFCDQCGAKIDDAQFAAVAHLAPTAGEAFDAIVRKPPRAAAAPNPAA